MVLSNGGRCDEECKIPSVGRCRLLVLEAILLVLSLDEKILSRVEYESVSKGFEDTPARGVWRLAIPEVLFFACLKRDWAMFDELTYGFVILWWLSSCVVARGSNGGNEVPFPSPGVGGGLVHF